jgi:hypothetical protein
MSNFSNIGFKVATEEEFQQLLETAYNTSVQIKINGGSYSVFTDPSGAELYLQFNKKDEIIGVNPHFKGKSRRTVRLTNAIERPASELDGAFHCWADPSEDNVPYIGAYPFVFDLPDFKTIGHIDFAKNHEIQLTAFAHELSIFDSEKEYGDSQTSDFKFATQSFIPSGLFSPVDDQDPDPPQAVGIFTGIIKEFERKRNGLTQEEFYWLLVDTLGGEVDIVADIRFFERDPVVNGIVQGQFWLSGQLLNKPKLEQKESKTFFQKLFKR